MAQFEPKCLALTDRNHWHKSIRNIHYVQLMVKPLLISKNAPKDLYEMMEGLLLTNSFFNINFGCPAVNLINELAAVSTHFNKALSEIIIDWQDAIKVSVENSKQNGSIGSNVNPKQVAIFLFRDIVV